MSDNQEDKQEESDNSTAMDAERIKEIGKMSPDEFRKLTADEQADYYLSLMVNNLNKGM